METLFIWNSGISPSLSLFLLYEELAGQVYLQEEAIFW